MTKSVLIFAKHRNAPSQQTKSELSAWLKKKKYAIVDVSDTKEKISAEKVKSVVLGVVIGGDGTFLTLVRRLEKKEHFPILGINLGTLGFITDVNREQMLEAVDLALKGKYIEQRRPLLKVDVVRKNKVVESGLVFNDAVITKDATTLMLKFEVFLGQELLSNQRADGYICATPTGSTAYALSAGGPILHPEVAGIVLAPICSHSLSARPTVVPQNSAIRIAIKDLHGAVYLVYDGQISFEIEPFDQIQIQTSTNSLRLVRSPQHLWSETVRTKLKMG